MVEVEETTADAVLSIIGAPASSLARCNNRSRVETESVDAYCMLSVTELASVATEISAEVETVPEVAANSRARCSNLSRIDADVAEADAMLLRGGETRLELLCCTCEVDTIERVLLTVDAVDFGNAEGVEVDTTGATDVTTGCDDPRCSLALLAELELFETGLLELTSALDRSIS